MNVSQDLDQVIKILTSSHNKSDSEKFAALLLVTKLTKSSELSNEDEFKVFQSIPLHFVMKLLKTKSKPSDCYKSIALSILRSFSAFPFEDIMVSSEILTVLIEIIKNERICVQNSNCDYMDNKDDRSNDINNDVENNNVLVNDSHSIIRLMMQSESGKEAVFKSDALKVLSFIINRMDTGLDDALTTFLIIICHNDPYKHCENECLKLLENLANILSDIKKGDKLLKVLDVLVKILGNANIKLLLLKYSSETFWKYILESLYNLMTSKIDIIYCQKALLVSSHIINLYGFDWTILAHHESLVLILLHLASIEIRMILDELQEVQCDDSLPLLESITTMYIEAIKFVQLRKSNNLSTSHCYLSAETIQELIFDCIFTIINFITNCHDLDNQLENELLNPCLCFLSAYISFKEFALDEDIVLLVPILISACCKDYSLSVATKCIQGSSTIDTDMDFTQPSLLHLFLPGFEHLSHLDEVRQYFAEKKFISVLIDYMKMCSLSDNKDDVIKIVDIFYNFLMNDQLTDYLEIFNYFTENFVISSDDCNILILLFAILCSYSSGLNIQSFDEQKYVTTGISILKNKNCSKELREDLILHMAKCFSKYPEFSNYVSESDYKNIFLT